MRNSQVRSEIAKLKEKGVPFPLRATLARKRYELRGYCSQKFTFLREEGGCCDPECRCGADSVYGGTLKIKRKRKRQNGAHRWVPNGEVKVKERKFELTLNEMGMVDNFAWL